MERYVPSTNPDERRLKWGYLDDVVSHVSFDSVIGLEVSFSVEPIILISYT
jgi:hypothetical protein